MVSGKTSGQGLACASITWVHGEQRHVHGEQRHVHGELHRHVPRHVHGEQRHVHASCDEWSSPRVLPRVSAAARCCLTCPLASSL